MLIKEIKSLAIPDIKVIRYARFGDQRGYFSETFRKGDLRREERISFLGGLEFLQGNESYSKAGTLRGMHYQLAPKAETKLVRCIRGALYDVILDLRRESPTFGQSFGAELSAENRKMLCVPKGFAHGFITLADDTEAFYFVDEVYAPQQERGVRWNDPKFGIKWPMEPVVLSDKDRQWRDFDPAWHLGEGGQA